MDSKEMKDKFMHELKIELGEFLSSLRSQAGLTHEQAADEIVKERLGWIKRLEAGGEELHGSDLLKLIKIYGADAAEVMISISALTEGVKSRLSGNIDVVPKSSADPKNPSMD